MVKKAFLGAALGFVVNFQSAYNPFYMPNWLTEKQIPYYTTAYVDYSVPSLGIKSYESP